MMDELNNAMNPPEDAAEQETAVSPSAKFQSEAEAIMKKIYDLYGKLETLADKKGVSYTEEQVENMFTFLAEKQERCKNKYTQKLEDKKGFSFKF